MDGNGNNRGFITKDTNSLNLYYVGNLALGEVAGFAIYKDKIESTVASITFNKSLGSEFIVDATNWNNKLYEADAKTILENGTKNWAIPKENLKDTDVAYWAAGGAEGGLGLSYYNLMNTDLNKTAPLPTSIAINASGITATTTGDATKYARLDYRGLYINNGAVQITNNSGTTTINGNGIYADYIIGGTLTTFNFTGAGTNYIEMSKQMTLYKMYNGGSPLIKLAHGFLPDHTGTEVPISIYGAGAGNDSSVAKGYITKTSDSFNFYYISAANAAQGISIKADGIYCTSELKLNTSLATTYLADGSTFTNKLQKMNTSGNFGVGLSGAHIELTESLITKNSSNQTSGITTEDSGGFSVVNFWQAGVNIGYVGYSSGNLDLRGDHAQLGLYSMESNIVIKPGIANGYGWGSTQLYGDTDFTNTTVTGTKKIHVGTSAPTDTAMLWLDTN